MTDLAEQTAPRRGMSFPFFVTTLLFAFIVADRYLLDGTLPDSGARHPYVLGVVAGIGILLWLWVLDAARRRRAVRFDGPVQTARGTNGALQPMLATIMIVVGANLAYTHTIPKWFGLTADEVSPGVDSGPASIFDVSDEEPVAPGDDEPLATAEEMLDAITGARDDQAPATDKTGRLPRPPQ